MSNHFANLANRDFTQLHRSDTYYLIGALVHSLRQLEDIFSGDLQVAISILW